MKRFDVLFHKIVKVFARNWLKQVKNTKYFWLVGYSVVILRLFPNMKLPLNFEKSTLFCVGVLLNVSNLRLYETREISPKTCFSKSFGFSTIFGHWDDLLSRILQRFPSKSVLKILMNSLELLDHLVYKKFQQQSLKVSKIGRLWYFILLSVHIDNFLNTNQQIPPTKANQLDINCICCWTILLF